jgi:hypothetical protein
MVEINKNIELIQVLLFLANLQEKTRQQIDNIEYVKSMDEFFSDFKNHEAVVLTKGLIINHWFTHITPLSAILYLQEIINDDDNYKDIQNLKLERNISSDELKGWAIAVNKFIVDANFQTFFNSQHNYYSMIVDMVKSWGYDKWIQQIEKYFRSEFLRFKLIISPLNGNYGFVLDKPEVNTSYVVRCLPYYDKEGKMTWEKEFFAKGVAHEFAHCFVNPIVEDKKVILYHFKSFFDRHKNMFKSYNLPYAVINEYLVRAFAIRFMELYEESFPTFDIQAEYIRQREHFIYIDKFVEMLKEYEKSNETFNEFYFKNISSLLIID